MSEAGQDEWPEVDPTIPNGGRIYDYLLGGTAHFPVDRAAAEATAADDPYGIENARTTARVNRDFLVRVMHHLVEDAGMRQFLDIGSGLPNADNVHALAQNLAPESRVVYVDNDPVVLAHSHQLLRGAPAGQTDYLYTRLQEPEKILEKAAATLNFDQPVALTLVSVLHYVTDDEKPHEIVSTLLDALPSGSYLTLSHLADGMAPIMNHVVAKLRESTGEAWQMRDVDQIQRFFAGLEVVDPGVVPISEWPDASHTSTLPDGSPAPFYVGTARKP